MTQDRLPHAGERDGLYYSMGYSGHGTQMSVLHGRAHGRGDGRRRQRQPLARAATGRAIPGHFGPPWFLPAVGLYYRLKDRLA